MATAKRTGSRAKAAETEEFSEATESSEAQTLEIPFTFEKQTASARSPKLRYKEDDSDGPTLVVGSLYINKSTVDKYGEPKITVLVEF